jgi:glucosyl-3-phosphoglycerate synthase
VRGGPYAELALRLGLTLARNRPVKLTSLHLLPFPATVSKKESQKRDAAFRGMARVLGGLPEVERRETVTQDPAETILAESKAFELVIMGATARHSPSLPPVGAVAERLLRESPANLVIVKTQRPMPPEPASEAAGQRAISILVDKWFAENTFHADEFTDLGRLLELKREHNLSISLALPALNEADTVGHVIGTVKRALMDRAPLLDEIVLIDSNSTDQTRAIAEKLGVPVYIHQELLPAQGARRGKGEALWKSLLVTRGDLIAWIDTDIVNIHPRFVYGLIGPLLINPQIQFIKGFYRRPLKVGDKLQAGGGGRVTELTARPLINLFYPELSGVIQPLSGEYAGRRAALERLPFSSGYGVETGLLIDVFERFGLGAIAQVDLRERVHHNQPLDALSKMSFAIIQTVIRKLERRYGGPMLDDVNRTMKLIRYEPGRFFLDVEEIAEYERPPMVEVEEYQQRHRVREA